MMTRHLHNMLALLLLAIAMTPGPARSDPAASAASEVVAEAGMAADVTAKFAAFCKEWMGKLAARERDNVANIKWDKQTDTVVGAYTGYSQEHTCMLKAGTGAVPIGKIVYVETRYEKSGATQVEAQGSTPKPVDAVEVTEIFRYKSGKWEF